MGLHDRDYYQRDIASKGGRPEASSRAPTAFAQHFAKQSRVRARSPESTIVRAAAAVLVVVAIVAIVWALRRAS